MIPFSILLHRNPNTHFDNTNSSCRTRISIIKYIYFEPIHYAINFDVVSSFMIFSEFDYMFLMGSKTTRAWAQTSAKKLGLRGDKEADPIKDIKEFGPPHMPKHDGSGQGPSSTRLRSR